MTPSGCTLLGVRTRVFWAALLSSAFLLVNLAAGASPALAYSPITGVTVSVQLTKSVLSGDAVYAKATVLGTGDYDHRVTWSLSPPEAGTVSLTGLYISSPTFTGNATIKATSFEAPYCYGQANVNVSAGVGAIHVDLRNAGVEDGTALHPYRTIQGAIANAADGDTIKVAQGTYIENVTMNFAVLLLGGFQGNSAANYALGQPGDFVTRSVDHVSLVTTIQSPARANPVVYMENWSPPNTLTYAVDGFTVMGGFRGLDLRGRGTVDCFVSQNLIINNGPVTPVTYDSGGGILAYGVNSLVLNNRIADNVTDWGGGIFIDAQANSFLVQGNLIENNIALGGLGNGGGGLAVNSEGQGPALFTWNIVRGNRAGDLLNYGFAGGLGVGAGRLVELSHNVYADNQAKDEGAGVALDGMAVLRHELIYRNSNNSPYSAAGVHVHTNSNVTLEHCTITGNVNAPVDATGGLYVRETATAQVGNSIIWGNSGNQFYIYEGATFSMTYSDSQPFAGAGNISVDPIFANPAGDDYHLQSQRGRWNPATSSWVADALQSPCIDVGNPGSDFSQEPMPHGSRTNMGAYGNTPEASLAIRGPITCKVLDLLLGG